MHVMSSHVSVGAPKWSHEALQCDNIPHLVTLYQPFHAQLMQHRLETHALQANARLEAVCAVVDASAMRCCCSTVTLEWQHNGVKCMSILLDQMWRLVCLAMAGMRHQCTLACMHDMRHGRRQCVLPEMHAEHALHVRAHNELTTMQPQGRCSPAETSTCLPPGFAHLL